MRQNTILYGSLWALGWCALALGQTNQSPAIIAARFRRDLTRRTALSINNNAANGNHWQ